MAFLASLFGTKKITLENATTAGEVRTAILDDLRTHRRWYHRWSLFYGASWNILTLLVLVLGALTSILTAIGGFDQKLLVTLPALSSLCAALLIQFRLKEACRIRESGRIATELLICRALLIGTDDLAKARRAAVAIRKDANELEHAQLEAFMKDDEEPAPDVDGPAPDRD